MSKATTPAIGTQVQNAFGDGTGTWTVDNVRPSGPRSAEVTLVNDAAGCVFVASYSAKRFWYHWKRT